MSIAFGTNLRFLRDDIVGIVLCVYVVFRKNYHWFAFRFAGNFYLCCTGSGGELKRKVGV